LYEGEYKWSGFAAPFIYFSAGADVHVRAMFGGYAIPVVVVVVELVETPTLASTGSATGMHPPANGTNLAPADFILRPVGAIYP